MNAALENGISPGDLSILFGGVECHSGLLLSALFAFAQTAAAATSGGGSHGMASEELCVVCCESPRGFALVPCGRTHPCEGSNKAHASAFAPLPLLQPQSEPQPPRISRLARLVRLRILQRGGVAHVAGGQVPSVPRARVELAAHLPVRSKACDKMGVKCASYT